MSCRRSDVSDGHLVAILVSMATPSERGSFLFVSLLSVWAP